MAPSNIQSLTLPSRKSVRPSPGASVQGVRGANDFIDVSGPARLMGSEVRRPAWQPDFARV
jgi:hypothetical protein